MHGLEDARRLLTAGVDQAPTSQPTLRADLLLDARRCSTASATAPPSRSTSMCWPRSSRSSPSSTRHGGCRVMINRCRWLFHHSDYAGQHALAEQAIALAESHGLADLAMEAQLWLGKGLTWEGKHEEARAALDASLAAGRRAGRRVGDRRVAALPGDRRRQRERVRPRRRAARRDDRHRTSRTATSRTRPPCWCRWRRCSTTRATTPRRGHRLEQALPILVEHGVPVPRGGGREQPRCDRRAAGRARPRSASHRPRARAVQGARRSRGRGHRVQHPRPRSSGGSAISTGPRPTCAPRSRRSTDEGSPWCRATRWWASRSRRRPAGSMTKRWRASPRRSSAPTKPIHRWRSPGAASPAATSTSGAATSTRRRRRSARRARAPNVWRWCT